MTRTPLRRLTTSLIAVLALVACLLPSTPAASRPVIAAKPTPGSSGAGDPYFPLYGNGGYNVLHYGLDVRYDPKTDILTGQASLKIRADKSLSRFDLDLVGLTVRSITVDGRPAHWTRRADHELVITPARALRKRHVFVVVVRYDGKPRRFSDPNLGTYGFLTTDDGAIAVGEPEVAAFWYPVDDHPKDKATYSIKLTVPRGLQAISNGLPAKTRYSTRSGKRWASTTWTEKHPMASYLAFMAVGHFTIHRWHTASGLPVIDAVDPSLAASVRGRINSSFAKQGKILAAESRWFGRYPFEAAGGVVDKVEVGFALENETRPTYSSDFWAFSDDPADSDYVVVHELAHQWYGDSVSLKRWADIWLNEGFATYAEWLWLEKTTTATPQEIADETYRGFPADDHFWKVPPGAPGRNAVFGDAVYERGAMALQALRQAVGKAAFFKILQAWPRLHADGHGTTRQFIALSEKISGRQLDALFQAWLFSPTKPAVAPSPNSTLDSRIQTPHERAVHADIERWRRALDGRLRHGAR